jgi:hypothetical protein
VSFLFLILSLLLRAVGLPALHPQRRCLKERSLFNRLFYMASPLQVADRPLKSRLMTQLHQAYGWPSTSSVHRHRRTDECDGHALERFAIKI